MTGIPLSRLEEEESNRLLKLEDELRKRVIGQDKALEAVAKSIRRSRAGSIARRRPIASFYFSSDPQAWERPSLRKTLSVGPV